MHRRVWFYRCSFPKTAIITRFLSKDCHVRRINGFARRQSHFRLSNNPGVVKGPQPIELIQALTTCASKRMKTHRFSYFAWFAARERMREAKHGKNSKKWQYATFSTLKAACGRFYISIFYCLPAALYTCVTCSISLKAPTCESEPSKYMHEWPSASLPETKSVPCG